MLIVENTEMHSDSNILCQTEHHQNDPETTKVIGSSRMDNLPITDIQVPTHSVLTTPQFNYEFSLKI